jgi:hypothetical protein
VEFSRKSRSEYLPEGHGKGSSVPRGQKLPGGHARGVMVADTLQYRPAGQGLHELCRCSDVKVPGAQGVGAAAPVRE